MENTDASGPSTAPLALHDFFERMRQPSATDFVKAIKSFVVSFSNNAPNPERDSAAVQGFLTNMESSFRAHPLWAGCSEEELESAGEGLEKYVMTKLFSRVFASLPDDVKLDDQLYENIALIQQFVRPEHLDIKLTFQNETSWLLAQKELQKINMYKAPREKLGCILNCCKVINNLLYHASIASNQNLQGADEFLPVLIYVTIKANPPQMHSNLLYIQRYRHQSRLVAEAAYFFTNMLSVESFISNINAKSLSMDKYEFENNMETARALLSGLSSDSDNLSNQSVYQSTGHLSGSGPTVPKPPSSSLSKKGKDTAIQSESSITRIPSLPDLENKGATMLLKEDQATHVFQEYPYLFAQVGDLTINDIEVLLNNYKELVFKYVCLSKGIAAATTAASTAPPLPPTISQTQLHHHADTLKEFESQPHIETTDTLNTASIETKDSLDTPIETKDQKQGTGNTSEDSSKDVSLLDLEELESKLLQDDSVLTHGGRNPDENSSNL